MKVLFALVLVALIVYVSGQTCQHDSDCSRNCPSPTHNACLHLFGSHRCRCLSHNTGAECSGTNPCDANACSGGLTNHCLGTHCHCLHI